MSSPGVAVVNVRGVRVAYRVVGASDAPPMVLLHGLGLNGSSWEAVASAFADSHRVFAPDLRGHGASDWPGRYSFELMRDDLLGFLDVLSLERVTLIGHSAGGVVAALFAQQYPVRLEHLVVEEAPIPVVGGGPEPIRPRPDGPLGCDWSVIESIVGQINAPDPAWHASLGQIVVPTLIIAGGPDSRLSQDRIVADADRIPGCALVTIPAGHHVHRDRPAEFVAAVRTFVDAERDRSGSQPAVAFAFGRLFGP